MTRGVAAGTAMTLLGQSHPEAQRPIGPIVAPTRQTTIGCWNVRTMAETTRLQHVKVSESNTLQSACDEKSNKKAWEHNYNVPVRNCLAHRHHSLILRSSNRIGSLSKNVFERRTLIGSGRASITVDVRSLKALLIKLLISGRTLLAVLSWCPAPVFLRFGSSTWGTVKPYFSIYSYQAVWYWVLHQRPDLLCHLESSPSVLTAYHWYLIWRRFLSTATRPHAWL